MGEFRWRLADDDGGQPALFSDDELVDRHVGKGEFRGMEFLHVNARRIINEVPNSSRMPFRFTINAYRGCSHACSYCAWGETPVLMGTFRTKRLADIRAGDEVIGTQYIGRYRRYVRTQVLDHWSTVKRAYRVTLEDGTELVASGDHRFLSNRGWKHVTGAEHGPLQRPFLTANNRVIGTGQYPAAPVKNEDYRLGYLCGMIRGDGHLGVGFQAQRSRVTILHRFRLALVDLEALHRTKRYLEAIQVSTKQFLFQAATGTTQEVQATRAQSGPACNAIRAAVTWPGTPSRDWMKGFLAGVFDAEGSYSGGILRFSNTDETMLEEIEVALREFRFNAVLEPPHDNGCRTIRIRGGLPEHMRFFLLVDPAITRKRSIEGIAVKTRGLRVVSIEDLGVELPMYDITTGTGDFIADGIVSHNCFARPTHEYLNLNIADDFEKKIVVKVNAVERLRAELRSPKWCGDHIAMGTNTDPYQRCEGKYHLTRGIIEVLSEARNPFSILTKSTLILRDLDVLAEANARTSVRANFSIGTLDEDVWRRFEPGTPHPRKRVEAVAKLNEAGIETGVLVAPVLPGVSDRPDQLEAVVKACVDAGAASISSIYLHLRRGVKEHFLADLGRDQPDVAAQLARRFKAAYLPKADTTRLAREIGRFVREHGGLRRPRPRQAAPPADRQPARPPPAPPPEQLSFS